MTQDEMRPDENPDEAEVTAEAIADETVEEAAQAADDDAGKAQEYLEALQRLQAEFDNYRKRMVKEQSMMIDAANEKLIGKLLPLLDNFERAVFVAEHTKDMEGLIKGVEMVYAEFVALLEKEGLEEIPSQGLPFDPNVHEAVMEVESPDHDPHTVVDVLRKGYRVGSKLVRPAMVKVAKG